MSFLQALTFTTPLALGALLLAIWGLPESAQRKILGENAVRFYGLSAPNAA